MGFTVERNGFTSVADLITALINDLADHGFTVQHHNGDPDVTVATEATLEAGPNVDPLSASQPWRLKLVSGVPGGSLILGTDIQLPDTGLCFQKDGTTVAVGRTALNANIVGVVENHVIVPTAISPASPYSYRVSITERGFAFHAWQNANLEEKNWSLLCVQRLVNPLTGAPYLTGHSPVMALFSVDSGATFKKIVVREDDVLCPTDAVVVSTDGDYSGAVINIAKQLAIAETNQYFVTCPAGFNTHRHLYNEEMDIVTYTSAGVLSQFNDARLNMYGHAQLPFNAGSGTVALGDTVTGETSGATGIVRAIDLTSGAWSLDAAGTLKLHTLDGEFQSGENLLVGAAPAAVAAGASILEYRRYKGGTANKGSAEGVRVLLLVENGGI